MIHVPFTPRVVWLVAMAALVLGHGSLCHGMAGTNIVANAGSPVSARSNWPKGVVELLNDPARTKGWNDWFSEWPNDVNHYELVVKNTDDLNRLIKKFSEIKAKELFIHLSPMKEPRGLGWVTSLPEGNGTSALFSIGDQTTIDGWHRQLKNGKFGVMTFNKAPVAVGPTLTIFVQNPAVELKQLEIPGVLKVVLADRPGPFHSWNDDMVKHHKRPEPKLPTGADEKTKATYAAIQSFVQRREEASAEKKGN